MSDLLELYDSKGYTVTVRCIDLGLAQNNFRPVLRRVKLSDDRHIIIACSIERLPEVLKQVQQVGLMTEYHQFFIANLDAHTIDLEPFQYSGTNISTVRIVQTESAIMEKYAKYLNPNSDDENGEGMEVRETDAADEAESEEGEAAGAKAEGESQDPAEEPRGDDVNTENAPIEGAEEGTEGEADEEEGNPIQAQFTILKTNISHIPAFSPDSVRTQTALIYDAVMLLAEALKQLGVDNIRPKKINCFKNELTWEKGNSISNFMRNVRYSFFIVIATLIFHPLHFHFHPNSNCRLWSRDWAVKFASIPEGGERISHWKLWNWMHMELLKWAHGAQLMESI